MAALEATGNEVALRIDGKWKEDFPNAKVLIAPIKPGDAFRLRSGGGGGYGPPWERDLAAVHRRREAGLCFGHGGAPSFTALRSMPTRLRSTRRKRARLRAALKAKG